MKSDNYKYFKSGNSVVCIKEDNGFFAKIFSNRPESERVVTLYHTYIFDKYLLTENTKEIIYDGLVLKNKLPLYNGKNFILLSEFRRLKLKKLKRKIFWKKLVNIK
jgi:hypothetical protein